MEKKLWIGKTIKVLRLESELSFDELSQRSGIPVLELIKIEGEQRALSLEELESLLTAFGVGEIEVLNQSQLLEVDDNQDFVSILAENNVFSGDLEQLRELDLFLDSMHTQNQLNEYLNANPSDNRSFLTKEKMNLIKEMNLEGSEVDSLKQKLKEQGYYEI